MSIWTSRDFSGNLLQGSDHRFGEHMTDIRNTCTLWQNVKFSNAKENQEQLPKPSYRENIETKSSQSKVSKGLLTQERLNSHVYQCECHENLRRSGEKQKERN